MFHKIGSRIKKVKTPLLEKPDHAPPSTGTRTGLAAARLRGRVGERPPGIAREKLDVIIGALHGGVKAAGYTAT
jgi:hypothetical protein